MIGSFERMDVKPKSIAKKSLVDNRISSLVYSVALLGNWWGQGPPESWIDLVCQHEHTVDSFSAIILHIKVLGMLARLGGT